MLKKLSIFAILSFIVSIFSFSVLAQSPSEIQKRTEQIQEKIQQTDNINEIMKLYEETIQIIKDAGGEFGFQTVQPQMADTPEKEMERRRKIINTQFHQAEQNIEVLYSEKNEKIQIPSEALPIKGYIIIEGGETGYSEGAIDIDTGYAIREDFVGNLIIIKTYDPENNRFENQFDYEIETASTGIKLSNLYGKKCVRWHYLTKPKMCIQWANFLSYEINPNEKFPGFHSGVVNAKTENSFVTVNAYSPEITFKGSDSVTNIGIKCFGADWKLTLSEFETLINRGSLILRKEIGKKSGNVATCRPGSNITLNVEIQRDEKLCKDVKNVQFDIVNPKDKSRYVFDETRDILILELEAKTIPAHLADSVVWSIPELEGSHLEINPSSAMHTKKGRKIEVIYRNLPYDNNSFGNKTVKATLDVKGCKIEKSVQIQIFYPRDAKNNPSKTYPNWYYYWKQTPAAMPFGQNVVIKYHCESIPLDKCVCLKQGVAGQYNPYYSEYKTINVCNLKTNTEDEKTFQITLPAIKLSEPSTLNQRRFLKYTYIDTFAVAIMHEFTHFLNKHNFWPHGRVDAEDRDNDDVPDRIEPELGLNPNEKLSYWKEVLEGLDDEEILAYESTYDYPLGKYDKYDWAKPGKNWQDGE